MDYSVSGNISLDKEYDPFVYFQSALRYISSDHQHSCKKKNIEIYVKNVTGSHSKLSMSEEIDLYSPGMAYINEPAKVKYAPTVSKSILPIAQIDILPFEQEQAKYFPTERFGNKKKSFNKNRQQKPASNSQSKSAKKRRSNKCKKNKAVKRLSPDQPKAVHFGNKNMMLQQLNHTQVKSHLQQNGITNILSSIVYIKSMLK